MIDGRTFRFFTKDNRTLSFDVNEDEWASKLFTDLERACPFFRSTPTTFTPWTHTEQNCIHHHLDRSGLTIRQTYPNGTEKTLHSRSGHRMVRNG